MICLLCCFFFKQEAAYELRISDWSSDVCSSDLEAPIAVMCSESVWWRCHRRLLADHLIGVRGVDVVHLMHDGRHTPHSLTDGARVADGTVIYDVGVTPPLLSED